MASYLHSDRVPAGAVSGPDRPRPFLASRLCGLLLAAPTLAVLAVAIFDIPYEQSTCAVLRDHGYPCPTCGMTTAFRAMADGAFARAAAAHPAGPPLFAVFALAGGIGAAQAATGAALLERIRFRWWWLLVVLNGVLLGWAIKVIVGRLQGIYPLH